MILIVIQDIKIGKEQGRMLRKDSLVIKHNITAFLDFLRKIIYQIKRKKLDNRFLTLMSKILKIYDINPNSNDRKGLYFQRKIIKLNLKINMNEYNQI